MVMSTNIQMNSLRAHKSMSGSYLLNSQIVTHIAIPSSHFILFKSSETCMRHLQQDIFIIQVWTGACYASLWYMPKEPIVQKHASITLILGKTSRQHLHISVVTNKTLGFYCPQFSYELA